MHGQDDLLLSEEHYSLWRKQKLNRASQLSNQDTEHLMIDITRPDSLTPVEKQKIIQRCKDDNYCLYRLENTDTDTKKNIHRLAKQIGLTHLDNNLCADNDSLTSITTAVHKGQHEYIPYSNKKLSWHTDGYYNAADKQIHSMLLHCAYPAAQGGESYLMDHEIAYILLRDENPNYIKALTHPEAMTIPANVLDGNVIREAQAGSVFSLNRQGGLHMRYSARKRNIEWRQTTTTLEAVSFLENLLNHNNKFIIRYKFKAGEGIICKNILHRRTSFVDSDNTDKKRLLYRGRYFDQILTN